MSEPPRTASTPPALADVGRRPAHLLHLTERVARPAAEVAAYVRDPANLAAWAAGLGSAPRQDGDRWVVDTAAGPVGVAFVAANDLGVCDHVVTLPGGATLLVPMRVLEDGDACDVVFTVRRADGGTDDAFAADAAAVRADLTRLREVLERG